MEDGRGLAARLGKIGLWCSQLQWQPAAREQEAVAELEELGYPAVWVGEATGKEALTHAGLLLAGSRQMIVATGIASIWARDPMAMANAGRTLHEAYPGRFVLGLGVSHPFLNEPRDRRYVRPLEHMATYLESMDRAPFAGPPSEMPPRLLAALGPKMLELARERTSGAHPYFVPVEHTARARGILGPDPVLAPEQAAILESDPEAARRIARAHTTTYLKLASYSANLLRLGWTEEDMSNGGSDRLVDALVAWGGVEDVLARARAHLDAGADHVAIRILGEDPKQLPMDEWRALAQS